MAQNNKSTLLKAALIVYAVLALIYGLGVLFFPQTLVEINRGGVCASGWMRWSGGMLVAVGLGAICASRKLQGQDVFIKTIALATLFVGLAFLYGIIFEGTGDAAWFTYLPALLNLVLSAVLWWARSLSKEILKTG